MLLPVLQDGELQGLIRKYLLGTLTYTEPMAFLLKPGGQQLHHDQRVSSLDTTGELDRDRVLVNFYVSGTAAMMPCDVGDVADLRLKVHSSRNLRLVDASIFLLIPRGNNRTTGM